MGEKRSVAGVEKIAASTAFAAQQQGYHVLSSVGVVVAPRPAGAALLVPVLVSAKMKAARPAERTW